MVDKNSELVKEIVGLTLLQKLTDHRKKLGWFSIFCIVGFIMALINLNFWIALAIILGVIGSIHYSMKIYIHFLVKSVVKQLNKK